MSKGKYWLIPSTREPYFSAALKYIGMSDDNIKSYSSMFSGEKNEKIFIFNNNNNWTWASENWESPYEEIDDKFKGEVPMDEIELIINSKKYNL